MMQPFQKSTRRQQRHKARKLSSRFSSLESLENRALLTGTGFEVDLALADHSATAQVSTASNDQQRVQRIVNGEQTSDHESVGIVNNGCSGTLIALNAVLTAAHCIPEDSSEPQDFQVGGKTYDVARVVVHPDYGSRDIDLAVMILNENVTGIEPSDINRTAPQIGQMLTLVGFGGTGTAQGGHNGDFGVKHEGTTPIDVLTDTEVNWNFDNASEANTAPGDSGGPAFVNVNGKLVIAGVTSGGTQDNAGLGDYSFDTRVDTFADWIDGVVAGGDGGNGGDVTPPGGDVDEPVDEQDPTDENPIGEDPGDSEVDQDEAVALATEELELYDTDGNGAISQSELVNELLDYGYENSEARDEAGYVLEEYDLDGDGELNRDELIISYGGEPENSDDGSDDDVDEPVDEQDPVDEDPMDEIDEEPIDEAADQDEVMALVSEELDSYDTDGNGALSETELVDELLDYGYENGEARDEAAYWMEVFDADGDGELSRDELIASYGGEPEYVDDSLGEEDVDQPVDDDLDDGNFDDPIDEGTDGEGDWIFFGDMDGDGWVDFGDFLGFSSNFGESGDVSFEDGDFNGDGSIGFDDFLGLSGNFGTGFDDLDFERGSAESTDHVFAQLCE